MEKQLLKPTLDYVFKRIFGYTGNEEITEGLLSAILQDNITNVELDKNPILERDLLDDKLGILDIRSRINNNTNINIEIQVVNKFDIEKRILYYWSKLYSKSLNKGEKYKDLEKTVVILFTDYELESLKGIEKYATKWNLREEEYTKIILTNVLEIYIIELPKARNNKKNTELDKWVEFIINPEKVDSMKEENKALRKAKEVLEEISQDEHELYLADLREKYILDKNSIEYGAREEGAKEKTTEIAKKMKEDNIDINIISKYTGLTKEEIKNL